MPMLTASGMAKCMNCGLVLWDLSTRDVFMREWNGLLKFKADDIGMLLVFDSVGCGVRELSLCQ